MFASIKLNTRAYPDVICVPSAALTAVRNKSGLYVVRDGIAHFVEVSPGVTVDNETEIQSGLSEEDVVVVQGQQFLNDGARVNVIGGAEV
jgi:hypothetical protein